MFGWLTKYPTLVCIKKVFFYCFTTHIRTVRVINLVQIVFTALSHQLKKYFAKIGHNFFLFILSEISSIEDNIHTNFTKNQN